MGTGVFDPWFGSSSTPALGAGTPYRPFPDKPYFRFVLDEIHRNKVLLIEKSRDMVLSWLCVGYFTHAAITTERREVLFQSQTEDKAAELIDYARILYEQQTPGSEATIPVGKAAQKPVQSEAGICQWQSFGGDSRRRGSDPLLPPLGPTHG